MSMLTVCQRGGDGSGKKSMAKVGGDWVGCDPAIWVRANEILYPRSFGRGRAQSMARMLLRDREGLCRGELQGLGLQYKKVQLFKQCIALKGFVEQQVKN